jgi:hypothetical protein
VIVDGRAFTNVGVHLKGMGSFRPLHEKPSFAVKFDEFEPDQEFAGLTKLMLNNSSQDGTHLCELLATSLFREAGVPAARVTHARVEFNGRDLGFYVLIEAMNKRFLNCWFRNTRGNLYEAYTQDVDQPLDQDGGADTSQADLKALAAAAKEPAAAERRRRLESLLDVDRFFTFTALEMMLAHWDGYAMNKNNYRLYHDPATRQFAFIAHGLDGTFGDPRGTIYPPARSLLVRALVQTAEGRAQYRQRVGVLLTNVWRVDRLTNRVYQAAARLKTLARSANETNEINGWAANLCDRLAQRAKGVAELLAQPPPEPLQFTDGVARLAGWWEKADTGAPGVNKLNVDGRDTLHLAAPRGEAVASWRTRVLLDQGKYRFTGQARAAGVQPLPATEPGVGAGLRISGEKRANQLTGDTDWRELAYDFEVPDGGGEIELVCELRAKKGDVWFAAASLRLVRK